MSMLRRWESRVRRWWYGEHFKLWYHPDYRLPITSLESSSQMEPRRADFVVWYLLDVDAIEPSQIERPRRISVRDMARVHDCDYLNSLTQPDVLGEIFGVGAWDVPAEEVLRTVRLACGGTLYAARHCLEHEGTALNVLGGFHHAAPAAGARMCPLNDIAIAIKALRADDFAGQIVVLDLDAHAPTGLAACLVDVPDVWIGSLSGAESHPLEDADNLPGAPIDETLLPADCDDKAYLEALEALLARMPRPALAFVIAGGDVLRGDQRGGLGLSLEGAIEREAMVCGVLAPCPTVWLPGGGYHKDAWRVLAGAGLYLATRTMEPVAEAVEPLRRQFDKIASTLTPEELDEDTFLTEDDLQEILGVESHKLRHFLGYYTVDGIELALYQLGVLPYIRRLGYEEPLVKIDRTETGDRFQLWGHADGKAWLLVEVILEKVVLNGEWMLYIHWLTLRHPRGQFASGRVALPGQEVPGLGLAKEASQMLSLIAKRLQLKGLAYRPAWFHVAYSLRRRFRFMDPARQGRFEAMIRDLASLPLHIATSAVANGEVLLDQVPYTWEAEAMIYMPTPSQEYRELVDSERDRAHFSVVRRSHHENDEDDMEPNQST